MDDDRKRMPKRPRSPSRSPTPPRKQNESRNNNNDSNEKSSRIIDERERHEMERRKRMARLRAENEAEEKKLAKVDEAVKIREEGGEYDVGISSSKKQAPGKERILEVNHDELEEMDEEDQMMKLFGFGQFDSTKGKSVEDNQNSASKGLSAKNKARKYRQYMNRKGGFNRPLDKMN